MYYVENTISNYYFHTISKYNGSDRTYFIMLRQSGWDRGSTVVKVLVRSQLMSLEFFIDIKSFRSQYSPGVD